MEKRYGFVGVLRPSLVILAASAAVAGCRPEEKIRTYRVARPAGQVDTAPEARPAPRGEPTDRLIGAIVPGKGQAWFFKSVGPRGLVNPLAEDLRGFLGSVRIDGDAPAWETPRGWSEEKGEGMRFATLRAGGEASGAGQAGEVEVTVIGLPLVGDWTSQLLDNANRWRTQLGLAPAGAADGAAGIEPLEAVASGAVLVDCVGWFDGGPSPRSAGGIAAAPSAPIAAPLGSRPSAPAAAGLRYEIPAGWTEDAGASPIRRASLSTAGGCQVTAFAFPDSGAMADPLENVNRWRGEVGLGPIAADALGTATESMDLLGGAGRYFELRGETESTHAAMVARDGQVWFFKIRGPGPAIEPDAPAFRAWLESLTLAAPAEGER